MVRKIKELIISLLTSLLLSVLSIVGFTIIGFIVAGWLIFRAIKYPFRRQTQSTEEGT